MTDAAETPQAELEELEREPVKPAKKAPKRAGGKGQPRDDLGRFSAPNKGKT